MATTYTPLLGLAKHATTDPFDVTLLNDNANTLDTAMGKAYRGKAAHNLLDNSDFSDLVNQRGTASGAQIGPYNTFLDRWYHGGNTTVTLTINSQGIIFKSNLMQKMTQETLPNGTTVTAAAKYTDGTLTLVSGTINIQDGWHWFSSQMVDGCRIGIVDGVGTSGNPYVRIENENGKTLSWAALYEGTYTADTLPEYVPKGYAAELAECQRYFERKHVHIYTKDQDTMYISAQFTEKRVYPTITVVVESSDNVETNALKIWNQNCTSAGGIVGSVPMPAEQAHWYGYLDISADL